MNLEFGRNPISSSHIARCLNSYVPESHRHLLNLPRIALFGPIALICAKQRGHDLSHVLPRIKAERGLTELRFRVVALSKWDWYATKESGEPVLTDDARHKDMGEYFDQRISKWIECVTFALDCQRFINFLIDDSQDQTALEDPNLHVEDIRLTNYLRQLLSQNLILDTLCGSEGLRAQRYDPKSNEFNQRGNIRIHVVTLPSDEWQTTDINIHDRMKRIYSLDLKKWDGALPKFVFHTYNQGNNVETLFIDEGASIGLVNGSAGTYNLTRILLHFIRNAAKHGYVRGRYDNLDIVIELCTPSEFLRRDIFDGYAIRIYSNVSPIVDSRSLAQGEFDSSLLDDLNARLHSPILREDGELERGYSGVKEFRIRGTYLCSPSLNIPELRLTNFDRGLIWPYVALLAQGNIVPCRFVVSPIGTLGLEIGNTVSNHLCTTRSVGVVMPGLMERIETHSIELAEISDKDILDPSHFKSFAEKTISVNFENFERAVAFICEDIRHCEDELEARSKVIKIMFDIYLKARALSREEAVDKEGRLNLEDTFWLQFWHSIDYHIRKVQDGLSRKLTDNSLRKEVKNFFERLKNFLDSQLIQLEEN